MDLTETFPASWAQRRLWFIQTMHPSSAAYNMVLTTALPVAPDPAALRWSLDTLVHRHEALRTAFALQHGDPVQLISDQATVQLEVCAQPDSEHDRRRLVAQFAASPFDLTEPPLVRALLATGPSSPSSLTLVVHHIIADGQTLRVLLEELDAIYRARVAGEVLLLPELAVQYADYAVWQRRSLTGRRLESLTSYWRARLGGVSDLEFHHDHPRPPAGSSTGSVLTFQIPPRVAARLRELASAARTTLFSTLLTGVAVALARFSAQSSFGIGIPVSGRARPELERVAGLFINSVVFRAEVGGDETFAELVRRTGAAFAEDLSHQELPFDLVVDALGVKRRADRNPLFQVMCQLQAEGAHPPRRSGASDEPAHLSLDVITAQLDLSFIHFETQSGAIEGGVVYASDLFDRETIVQLVDAYLLILDEGSRQNAPSVAALPVLTPPSRAALLAAARGDPRAWPAGESLHGILTQASTAWPDSGLVDADGTRLTYAQLDRTARRIAAALQRLHVLPGTVVAICLPRSAALIAAVLGVLKTGASYVILDPASPGARLEFILSDCEAAAVIVPSSRTALAGAHPHLELRDVESWDDVSADVPVPANHPAYVIYTSGSTGQPKGVAIPHGAIVNHMRWMLERFPLAPADRVLQRTPLSFDASVWELFAPLLSGATLVLAPHDERFDPKLLGDLIRHEGITTLQVVPSLLRALLDQGELQRCTTLRRVFCGGEALTADLSARFLSECRAELCNLYGPSETTIDATYHVCQPDDCGDIVPIGRPIANVVTRVLDDRLQLVPYGVSGELHVGGHAVGIGYLGRPELTAERFIDDPFEPGGRLFRTGDRVRMTHDGTLHFLGRFDDQIKLRGFRIEPGEIDAALLAHPAVRNAATVVQDFGIADRRLVSFVEAERAGAGQRVPELLGWLRSRLPAYQVPSTIEIVDSLPQTVHGKVDRRALALRMATREDPIETKTMPRTADEREICRCFEEMLKAGDISIDDDFFLLGGHSLLVVTLAQRLAERLGCEISVVDVFEFPTPRQLGEEIASRTRRVARGGHAAVNAVAVRAAGGS